jgi:integrase
VLLAAEAWCEEHGADLRTVAPDLLREWVETVPFSTSSRRRARNALGHYWEIHSRPSPPLYIVRVPRKARAVCRALEVEEAHMLAKTARARGGQEGLATLFALYLALRRMEIAKLRWVDFQEDGWLRIVGKREQSAMLPVHPVVLAAMAEHGRLSETWVFPGRIDGHAHPATVWNWVRLVAAEAGVERMTVHRARHTALATALDSTGDLRAVQEFARHASPSSTAIYTRVTARRLTGVMDAIDYDL